MDHIGGELKRITVCTYNVTSLYKPWIEDVKYIWSICNIFIYYAIILQVNLIYVPGHALDSHSSNSFIPPTHCFPPFDGVGLPHDRCLERVPLPQVLVQDNHPFQVPHLPSTILNKTVSINHLFTYYWWFDLVNIRQIEASQRSLE